MRMVLFARTFFITISLTTALPVIANDIWPTCAEKKQKIEAQLQYAQANNIQAQITRLKNEKNAVMNLCSNTVLRQKYVKKVDKYKTRVQETEQKLKKAQLKKDTEKISQLEGKLTKNQRKYKQAIQKLDRFDHANK